MARKKTDRNPSPLSRATRSESQRQRVYAALEACDLHYRHQLSQKEVATRLGISPATVSRLLQFGRDAGLVRISLEPPKDIVRGRELAARLTEFGIREVIVAGSRRVHVGQAAASYFEAYGRDRCTLVLGPGLTVAEFVARLSVGVFSDITAVPLCADPPSYEVSTLELTTRVAMKYQGSKSIRMPAYQTEALAAMHRKVRQTALRAEFVILGVGPWRHRYMAIDALEHLGLDGEKVLGSHPAIVAACGMYALDTEGRLVPLPEVDEKMPRSLSFEDLQSLAAGRRCRSLLLAHSREKCDAVLAALRARLVNTLIVDDTLAKALSTALAE